MSGKTYQELRSALRDHMMRGLKAFAEENGLRVPTGENLGQMSVAPDDVMDELMWFGFDSWPPGTGEDDGDEEPPSERFSIGEMLRRMAGVAPALACAMASMVAGLTIGISLGSDPSPA